MHYLLVFILFICVLLSGCEYFIPHTSDALSQTKQSEELQQQTQQLERQADALEQLSNSAQKLIDAQK